jgi:hypothetical protein
MNTGRIASRRPAETELESESHRRLIAAVPGDCAITVLHEQMHWLCELASSLSTEQVDRVHPPYAWTVRQVFAHGADAERVFGYRMLCLADGSGPELPDWDQNVSADSRFGLGNFSHLVSEWGDLRKANIALLRRLVPRAWDCQGIVAGQRVTVRGLAWIAAGHLQHHLEIVEKRCGVTANRTSAMLE